MLFWSYSSSSLTLLYWFCKSLCSCMRLLFLSSDFCSFSSKPSEPAGWFTAPNSVPSLFVLWYLPWDSFCLCGLPFLLSWTYSSSYLYSSTRYLMNINLSWWVAPKQWAWASGESTCKSFSYACFGIQLIWLGRPWCLAIALKLSTCCWFSFRYSSKSFGLSSMYNVLPYSIDASESYSSASLISISRSFLFLYRFFLSVPLLLKGPLVGLWSFGVLFATLIDFWPSKYCCYGCESDFTESEHVETLTTWVSGSSDLLFALSEPVALLELSILLISSDSEKDSEFAELLFGWRSTSVPALEEMIRSTKSESVLALDDTTLSITSDSALLGSSFNALLVDFFEGVINWASS